jgi:hypothetical protein
MSEPKPERITEQVLEYLDREARYPNVEAAIADVIRLVAEVRQLRALIVGAVASSATVAEWSAPLGRLTRITMNDPGGRVLADLWAEAEAIRAERCPTGTSSEKT